MAPLALATNVKLGWKGITMRNTLTYYNKTFGGGGAGVQSPKALTMKLLTKTNFWLAE